MRPAAGKMSLETTPREACGREPGGRVFRRTGVSNSGGHVFRRADQAIRIDWGFSPEGTV